MSNEFRMPRRQLLKAGLAGAGVLALGGGGVAFAPQIISRLRLGQALAGSAYIEAWPTSPLILNPFIDPLPIPKALAPIPQSVYSTWKNRPGPGRGQQDSIGGTHQPWPSQLKLPDPLVYQIKLQIDSHNFTSSQVLPIAHDGKPTTSYGAAGVIYPAGT